MDDFSSSDWLIVGCIAVGVYMLVASVKNIATAAASGGAPALASSPSSSVNADMGGNDFGMEAGSGWDD